MNRLQLIIDRVNDVELLNLITIFNDSIDMVVHKYENNSSTIIFKGPVWNITIHESYIRLYNQKNGKSYKLNAEYFDKIIIA